MRCSHAVRSGKQLPAALHPSARQTAASVVSRGAATKPRELAGVPSSSCLPCTGGFLAARVVQHNTVVGLHVLGRISISAPVEVLDITQCTLVLMLLLHLQMWGTVCVP